jgi:ADP-heptose:LPS heptosyltransferase
LKLKLNTGKKEIPETPEWTGDERTIVFSHGRAPGDNIMFTAGTRDFCLLFPGIRVGVHKRYPWIWENNPYIDHSIDDLFVEYKKQRKENETDKKLEDWLAEQGIEYYQVGYKAVNSCNNTNIHFTQMFLLDMIAMVDLHARLPMSLGEFCAAYGNGEVGDPCLGHPHKTPEAREPFISLVDKYRDFGRNFTRERGDLHLSEKEMEDNLMRDVYGTEHYWVVAPGGKSDFTAKQWDWRRFQRVVDYFDGLITFVTVGSRDQQMFVDSFRGAIDLTDKFNKDKVRGLIPLIYHATGVISTPSLIMHLGAAVPKRDGKDKPGITIFGGREPVSWSRYCSYQILHTNGAYACCRDGGCWKNRIYPIPKSPDKNTSLCQNPVDVAGKTIQSCMDDITSEDMIRAIETYYKGDLYHYDKKTERRVATVELQPVHIEGAVDVPKETLEQIVVDAIAGVRKEINLIGNLNSKGGGEQSLCKIAQVLMDAGWEVTMYPAKHKVHENYRDLGLNIVDTNSLELGNIQDHMKPGLPLLFYANDTTGLFHDNAERIVEKSTGVVVGINYVNRPLPTSRWLSSSGKLKAIIFQNTEKMEEWDRDEVGYEGLQKYVMFGAIELDRFLEVCPPDREEKEELVVLKHCVPDYRKYVTTESAGKGEKIHVWQKHFNKEKDVDFYKRLLKDLKNIRFEFMEAHEEIVKKFKDEKRMVFHKFDSLPVTEFLSRGHAYLYRTSNLWRDNYPRTVAEALAAGLPVLTEPRDGTWERVRHGDTGFHCVHYDEYKLALKTFLRKEKYRKAMALAAKDWARERLDPRKWVDVIEEVFL